MDLKLLTILFAAGLLVGMVLLLELGRRLGRRRQGKDEEGAGAGLGAVEGAVFALMGLLIAFTFSDADTRRFSDRERHPDNELIPGVLIFRPESGLIYFNMDHVRDTILDRVRSETTAPRLVVLDLSAALRVDMHSAQMLGSVAEELTLAGIRVQAVKARSSVRERLRGEGVEEKLGGVNRFTSVADAVEAFQKQTTT
jgi:sulfate permease, SulP family